MSAPQTHRTEPAAPAGIDPRSPRFGAGITAVLLLVVIFLGLVGLSAAQTPNGQTVGAATVGERAGDPAFILLAVIAALFAWGAFAGVKRHPYGWLFKRFVRPRLGPPAELEAPEPPTFAQGVGLFVVVIGLALHLAGVPLALVIAAGAAFIAAFLNSVFGYCLGCQLYLLLVRARVINRVSTGSAPGGVS
ncbi:DUF4395 domain-containing protein [Plantibacter sp. YIM 135249]|uniref:DUF4395 domain-containing protein n=1 Tax=Plantibacter sp. YIM 135249 TaxID=3423918 RepID=UPI003D32800A